MARFEFETFPEIQKDPGKEEKMLKLSNDPDLTRRRDYRNKPSVL
jgi:hypothetical protein